MGSERTQEERRAFEQALAAIRRRERSVAELRTWLAERGFAEIEIEVAVAELGDLGELDDERFARLFAEDKRELAGWGPERIAAALSERGVGRGLVEAAVAEDREEQLQRAREQLSRRGGSIGDDRDRTRALGFLTRRGFDYELAYDAIRSLDRAN